MIELSLFMHEISPHSLSCLSCSFAPFCKADEMEGTAAVKQHRSLKQHEVFCLPKNKFQNLYAIRRGAVKSFQTEAGGKELIQSFYFAGEIIGYEAIYSGRYIYSAVSLTDTVLCEIPYDNFLLMLHSKPELQKYILYLMSQQLNISCYLGSTSAEQKLAGFLIDLSERLHPMISKTELLLPMSRQDIGNYLRLTAETISRVFSRLQRHQIISIANKKVSLLQPQLLRQIADGYPPSSH
jgi:CRP/FNR family transcriptional regulator